MIIVFDFQGSTIYGSLLLHYLLFLNVSQFAHLGLIELVIYLFGGGLAG